MRLRAASHRVGTACRRRGGAPVPVAEAPGDPSHRPGSRDLQQAALADRHGNGLLDLALGEGRGIRVLLSRP